MKSIVVLLTLFCVCQGQGTGCPKSWIRANDRCYYISGNYDTFDAAKKYCKDRKSQLAPGLTCDAHINLVEVLAAYRAKCPKGQICDQFWMGIQNITTDTWRTGNDLPIERKRRCQQWAKGYPRGLGTCGKMSLKGTRKRGTWKNANCTDRLKYVCITCPDGFYYMPEVNECIYVNLKFANWSVAQNNCSRMKKGAHLLTILDSAKQKAVENFLNFRLSSYDTHICYFTPVDHGGRLMWMGGQTTTPTECKTPFVWRQPEVPDIPFTYSNWWPGKPNCSHEGGSCVIMTGAMYNTFRWDDVGCHFQICSICEF